MLEVRAYTPEFIVYVGSAYGLILFMRQRDYDRIIKSGNNVACEFLYISQNMFVLLKGFIHRSARLITLNSWTFTIIRDTTK